MFTNVYIVTSIHHVPGNVSDSFQKITASPPKSFKIIIRNKLHYQNISSIINK